MTGEGKCAVPLSLQIEELELVCMAKQNALARARNKELKRSPEWIERRENIMAALWAAYETLTRLESGNEG